MAWETTEWACGHTGSMQLWGKMRVRESRVAHQAGRKCLACWLIEQWERENDPRANSPKRWKFAQTIAEDKGIRISGAEKPIENLMRKEQNSTVGSNNKQT